MSRYFHLVDCSFKDCTYYESKVVCNTCTRNKCLSIGDKYKAKGSMGKLGFKGSCSSHCAIKTETIRINKK